MCIHLYVHFTEQEEEDSLEGKEGAQLGQLMLYLLGAHLKCVQILQHLSEKKPTPILVLHIEDMRV